MSIKMYGLQLGHFGMDLEILLTGHPNYLLLPVAHPVPWTQVCLTRRA